MKVCLFGELSKVLVGSGIGSAIDHQEEALRLNGVEVTRDHNDKFDVIDINTIGLRSAYVAQKMKWDGIPVVMHTHTTAEDFKDSFRLTTRLAPRLKTYLRFFYDQADMLISPTEYTKNVIRSYGLRRETHVVSNGVNIERFKPDRKARESYRTRYKFEGIVPYSVGHVFKRKGILDFMELARMFPQNRFLWVGRDYGNFVDREIKTAVKNKPANVMITGFVKEIVAAYNAGDIFVFPSYCENQGIAILEAAACGKPIIVRDIPTYDGWLKHGVNCLKAKDLMEFQRHLRALMCDEKRCEELAENAHIMSQEHNLKIVGAQLKRAYESLM
ncbi:MAG: glycosyltransferase family 4 protein [Candidatus Altiarchaeota archaeon]